MLSQPFDPVHEAGLTELVAADEQVDQNDYSGSVAVSLGLHVSGEILQVTLYATETGTGAVLTPAGTLFLFDADPSISSGDTAMTLAARQTVIAQIPVTTGDWKSDTNGASAAILDSPVAFHQVNSLYFAWLHEDATSINSAAGDDESLDFNFWYRRDS
jgi:hypothetical protein